MLFIKVCEVPEVASTTTNSTRFVTHNTVVKYLCKLYYEAEGETLRSCVKGTMLPSFQINPLKCASELIDINEKQLLKKQLLFSTFA